MIFPILPIKYRYVIQNVYDGNIQWSSYLCCCARHHWKYPVFWEVIWVQYLLLRRWVVGRWCQFPHLPLWVSFHLCCFSLSGSLLHTNIPFKWGVLEGAAHILYCCTVQCANQYISLCVWELYRVVYRCMKWEGAQVRHWLDIRL